jgi:hypothetical protein
MMPMSKTLRITIGLVIWIAAGGLCWWCLVGRGSQSIVQPHLSPQLWDYAAGRRRVAKLDFEKPLDVRLRDPIFVVQGPESVRQVGEVAGISFSNGRLTGQAVFYSCAPTVGSGAKLTYHQTPYSIEWVLRTVLPVEKRQQIATELSGAFELHRDEVVRVLRPVVEDALQEAFLVVEQDLPPALERRREELEQLGSKYQREIVEKELVPLVRKEIWPIVRRHAEPTVNEVGREIWKRASLWRFGWRYAYDQTPLPRKNLAQQEWSRFLQEEIMPVLESHTEDFIKVQQQIFTDVARDPDVREVVRSSLGKIAGDPEAQRIAWEVVQEVIVHNPRLKEVFDKHWRSEKAQRAVRVAATRLEPTVHRIGEMLLGTPDGGITPEFARVLRNQILLKDRRWLVLETGSTTGTAGDSSELILRVSPGPPDALNPFVRESDPILSRRRKHGE